MISREQKYESPDFLVPLKLIPHILFLISYFWITSNLSDPSRLGCPEICGTPQP